MLVMLFQGSPCLNPHWLSFCCCGRLDPAAHLPLFVAHRDEAGLDQAMSLDGTALLGRRIRVGYAQPKKEQPAA